MKNTVARTIIIASLIGSAVIFLNVIDFLGIALRFLAVGEVPLIGVTVPSQGMFVIYALLFVAIAALVLPLHHSDRGANVARQRLPRRRYSSVS